METVKMIVVLTLISGVASFGLAAFNEETKPSIAENERQFTMSSITKVLPEDSDPDPCDKNKPEFDNKPDEDRICLDGMLVYRGRKAGKIVGIAIVSIGDEAYSGTITTLVGLDLDGTVTGIEVLKHAETPGLGAKIEDCVWRDQIVGEGLKSISWKVRKDGGQIDSISGATISSRSMIIAVDKAHALLKKYMDEIQNKEAMGAKEVCNAS